MKLDFSKLVLPARMQSVPKVRGHPGTVGTPAVARILPRPGSGDAAGTAGDAAGLTAIGEPESALCPRAPPGCPRGAGVEQPYGINVSPVSPPVPGGSPLNAADGPTDREAFEERAAIMEFDGGLTRVEAEAAALALLGPAE